MRGTLALRLEKPITFPLADHRVNQPSQNKCFSVRGSEQDKLQREVNTTGT